jgi:hypothetical protein
MFCSISILLWAVSGWADSLALWNFNDGLFEIDRGSGAMTSTFGAANIGQLAGSEINGQEGDPAGQALRLANSANNGRDLTWFVSTRGYDSIAVSFATSGTATGFSSNQFQYTVNAGLTWNSFGTPFDPATSFALQLFDLSGIPAVNDNEGAGFRIVFDAATTASGNNRIDNLLVSGDRIPEPPPVTPVPEPSTISLTLAGIALVGYTCRRRAPANFSS